MSAFVVSNTHINALVKLTALTRGHTWKNWSTEFGSYQGLGQMLWEENHKSVNYRYSDESETPRFVYDLSARTPTVVEGLKALNCYEYQSCEHSNWENSYAKRFCDEMRSALVHSLPGYNEASWEWR